MDSHIKLNRRVIANMGCIRVKAPIWGLITEEAHLQNNLYEAGNKVCEKQQSGVILTLLRNPNNRKEKDTSHGRKVVSL